MHNAPPVAYPLGRSHFQGVALALVWLAGVAVTILWWLVAPGFDWRIGVALAAVALAGVAAWLGWRSAPVGQLHWDGQVWRRESPDCPAGTPVLALTVALDLQRSLLIRLHTPDHAGLWLWVHRAAFPERWLDLRRAVYSRRKAWPAGLSPDLSLPLAAADFPAETDPPRPYP
ncbi:MAG: hypothetical protein ACT6Q9_02760 [Polaromonas sp.]|uniref:hypothetical protein n=1 Tax=Polaromonas sp. TaxID=1869339 RepID=UPI0040373EEC